MPRGATEEGLRRVYEENGVELVDGGARKKRDTITVLDGTNAYARLLDDIFYATRDGSEVLWFCADDSDRVRARSKQKNASGRRAHAFVVWLRPEPRRSVGSKANIARSPASISTTIYR